MLLVNELLFAYFSIGPSSKFNLWDYCYDDIQQRIPYSGSLSNVGVPHN